jgi:hypothetical protein
MALTDREQTTTDAMTGEMCESVCETAPDSEPEALPRSDKPIPSGPQSAPAKRINAATRQRQLAAVKHGLHLRAPSGLRLKSRRTRRLAMKVRATLPWLQPSDEPAVKSWCELELVTSRLFAAVLEKNEPSTVDLYRRVKTLQLAYERELGMTPASRAELGLTTVQTANVAEQFAQMHRRREEGA